MELNEIELAMKIYMQVFTSLKKHCEEHELCRNCSFTNLITGKCLLNRVPADYNIKEIEECIRADIEEEIKNGTE